MTNLQAMTDVQANKTVLLQIISAKLGGDNALKGRYIKERLPIEVSVGNIQGLIEQLRIEGHRICANQKGYFVPKTDDEWDEWVAAYRRRTMKQLKTLSVITKHDFTQKGEVFKATEAEFLEAGFEPSKHDEGFYVFKKSSVDSAFIYKPNISANHWVYNFGSSVLKFTTAEQFKAIHQVYLLQE